MTAELGGGIEPLLVVVDRLGTLRFLGLADLALAIHHDEETLDFLVGGPLFHFRDIGGLRSLGEELVHILDGLDPKPAGGLGEVEVVQFFLSVLSPDPAVQGPFGQGDLKGEGGGFGDGLGAEDRSPQRGGREGSRLFHEGAAVGFDGGKAVGGRLGFPSLPAGTGLGMPGHDDVGCARDAAPGGGGSLRRRVVGFHGLGERWGTVPKMLPRWCQGKVKLAKSGRAGRADSLFRLRSQEVEEPGPETFFGGKFPCHRDPFLKWPDTVKEIAVQSFQQFPFFGPRPAPPQPDQIQTHQSIESGYRAERGRVLADRGIALDHGMIPQPHPLVEEGSPSDKGVISDNRMSAEERGARDDVVVSEDDIVPEMGSRHQEIPVANHRLPAILGAAVDRGMLPDGIARSHPNSAWSRGIEGQILGQVPDDRGPPDRVVLSQPYLSHQLGSGKDPASRSHHRAGLDESERADLHVLRKPGRRIDNGTGMNPGHGGQFPRDAPFVDRISSKSIRACHQEGGFRATPLREN